MHTQVESLDEMYCISRHCSIIKTALRTPPLFKQNISADFGKTLIVLFFHHMFLLLKQKLMLWRGVSVWCGQGTMGNVHNMYNTLQLIAISRT